VSSRGRSAAVTISCWVALALYSVLLFYLSSWRVPRSLDIGKDQLDKLLHAGAYGLWALLFLVALSRSAPGLGPLRSAAWAAAAGTLYGALTELHQLLVPERSADVLDLLANFAGAALAAGAWWALDRVRQGQLRRGRGT
jgi:VanZ family protein